MSATTAQPTIHPGTAMLRAVRFDHERARVPHPWQGAAQALLGERHQLRRTKKGTPTFSAVEYTEGAHRGKRGVLHATALVMDFDHLDGDQAEQLQDTLQARGWAHLLCTTWSHKAQGEDDHCLRLLLPVTRPIRPAEYEPVWTAVNAALGHLADPNARDISRIWYVASCPQERVDAAWMRAMEGRAVDVDRAIAASGVQPLEPRKPESVVDALPEGGRNAGLMSLGGTLRRDGAERPELLEALLTANRERCQPQLEQAEVEGIVDSLLRYDPVSPLLRLNLTDAGNAERFCAHAGDRFGYVHTWASWLHFDGQRWQRDSSGQALRAAFDTQRSTAAEARDLDDPKRRAAILKHALKSESSARLSAALTVSQAMLPVPTERLDRDPDLLTVANGTLDLRTGELRHHDRDDWITRLAPVAYDPEATCPRWEAFLHRAMGGNEGLITFLQRAVGYSLTGHSSEQVLLLLYGVGANGKSTFLETLRAMLGDYSAITDFNTFMKRDSEGARNDLARLVGTRFVSAVEAEAGKPLAEALVKQLTGGDTITARFLFKEFFDFRPQFKIWLAANHKPGIRGSDHGIWRRIRLVPFTVTIPEAERDPRLTQKLTAELPGILAWSVRGCLDWREHGLGVPDEIRAATASYQDEMDQLGGFLEEGCVVEPRAVVTAKELYAAYQAWAEANGEKPRSQKALAIGLKERGYQPFRTGQARCWRGLRLRGEAGSLQHLRDG